MLKRVRKRLEPIGKLTGRKIRKIKEKTITRKVLRLELMLTSTP